MIHLEIYIYCILIRFQIVRNLFCVFVAAGRCNWKVNASARCVHLVFASFALVHKISGILLADIFDSSKCMLLKLNSSSGCVSEIFMRRVKMCIRIFFFSFFISFACLPAVCWRSTIVSHLDIYGYIVYCRVAATRHSHQRFIFVIHIVCWWRLRWVYSLIFFFSLSILFVYYFIAEYGKW